MLLGEKKLLLNYFHRNSMMLFRFIDRLQLEHFMVQKFHPIYVGWMELPSLDACLYKSTYDTIRFTIKLEISTNSRVKEERRRPSGILTE